MSRKALLAVLAAVAVAVLAWDLTRAPRGGAPAAPAPVAVAMPSPPALDRPAGSPAMPGAAGVRQAPNFLRPASVSLGTSTTLARDFSEALAYKALYDRLKGTAEGQSAEGQFFLYRILRACATVADRKGGSPPRPPPPAVLEERRQQIAAAFPEGDPRRAQRLAAFDKMNTDQCEGLSGVTVNEAELAQLLRNALAGGDPKARAWQVEQEMWQERRGTNVPRGGPTLSDPQLEALREAFVTKDPEAMVIAGRVFANTFRDLTVRIGPDQEPIENRAFMNAALLLACEYGYSCGENNARVLSACATQGHCGVASLPDYLFYYGASPYEAQVLDRYRAVLRQAIDTRDWSAITVQRGTRSPNTPVFVPGR